MEGKRISLEDIYTLIQSGNSILSNKIDNVKKDLESLASSVKSEIVQINQKINSLEEENKLLLDRLKKTERLQKKNNLILYGIKEREIEGAEVLIKSVTDIFHNNLGITLDQTHFSNCFRLGKKTEKPRPILLELLSYFKKQDILKKRAHLKGTGVFISEDLIPEERAERRFLVNKLKTAKINHHSASIKGNKLIVDGTEYSAHDLNYLFDYPEGTTSKIATPSAEPLEQEVFSPIVPRATLSEPSTPTVAPENPSANEEQSEEIPVLVQKPSQETLVDSDKKRKLDNTPSKASGSAVKVQKKQLSVTTRSNTKNK